jgi:hypothetical protein
MIRFHSRRLPGKPGGILPILTRGLVLLVLIKIATGQSHNRYFAACLVFDMFLHLLYITAGLKLKGGR